MPASEWQQIARLPMAPFRDPAVAAKFASYPPRAKKALLALRELVFKSAGVTPGAGPIEETLK